MPNTVRRLTLLSFLTSFISVTAPAVAQDRDGPWWGCNDGYTLEVSADNAKARCVKAAVRRSQKPGCPSVKLPGADVKAVLTTDSDRTRDLCVLPGSAYGAKPTCPRRFKLKVKTGRDSCELNVPRAIRAPSVKG